MFTLDHGVDIKLEQRLFLRLTLDGTVHCSLSESSSGSGSSSSRTYRLTWHKLNTIASRTRYKNYREKN